MENKNAILAFTLFASFVPAVNSGCPVNRCEWFPWKSWSDCSRECAGGTRNRDRYLCCKADLAHSARLCMADCGWDYNSHRHDYYDSETCNAFCYNGGTYMWSGFCRCPDRYKGTCCRQVVTCGRPSTVSHGSYTGTDFTYAGQIKYACDKDYGMKNNSDAVRHCTRDGYWSGTAPICLYAVSCNSSPCKNGGRCHNLLGDYRCDCTLGWTGKNCDVDVQPPVVSGCPSDRSLFIVDLTTVQTWDEPQITDPHGTQVYITKNYETSSFEFPWGEHTISYHGVKATNGLSVECKFNISVKPKPCKQMYAPANGTMLCNGWRQDYSQICMFVCTTNYRLPPGFKESDIYVCGATGNWFPPNQVFQCVLNDLFPGVEIGKTYACKDSVDKQRLAEVYIDRLKASSFNELCQNYHNDCIHRNVVVTC